VAKSVSTPNEKPVLFQERVHATKPLVFIMSTGHSPDPARDENDDQAKPRIIVEQVNPWSGLDLNNDPNNFQFAIVTDRTGGHRPGVFPDAIGKLNLLQPEFVMSVGDLIEGNTEDQAQLDMEWDEFNGFIDELEVPFFYLPGNHDITNEYMAKDWERRFGRAYYHFVYRDVLFLCLNTEGPPTSQISPEQVEYWPKTKTCAGRWSFSTNRSGPMTTRQVGPIWRLFYRGANTRSLLGTFTITSNTNATIASILFWLRQGVGRVCAVRSSGSSITSSG
jgi:hypothetical protein